MAALFAATNILATGGGTVAVDVAAIFLKAQLLLFARRCHLAHAVEYATSPDRCR